MSFIHIHAVNFVYFLLPHFRFSFHCWRELFLLFFPILFPRISLINFYNYFSNHMSEMFEINFHSIFCFNFHPLKDLHTEGHTQWFYFAVSNTHPSGIVKLSEQGVLVPPVRVRFNIVNLTKPDSLFNSGKKMLH